jgi:hypothetical protein
VEEYSPVQRIFSFEFDRRDYITERNASRTLSLGAVNVRSTTTDEQVDGMFVVLHLGGYDFHCSVKPHLAADEYPGLKGELFRLFREDSTRNLLQAIDTNVGADGFALKDLFIEERRKIGRVLAKDALEKSKEHYRRIYDESRDVMSLLASLSVPAPESLKKAAEYVLSQRLEQTCSELMQGVLSETQLSGIAESIFREADSPWL